MTATLILGIGNPLRGDDGLGTRAVNLLAERNLPPEVEVEDAGTPGWGLAAWLEGRSCVFIVDAVQMGEPPGTRRRFTPEEVRLLAHEQAFSLHEPELASTLALAQALEVLPETIVIFGVEPASCETAFKLSQPVEEALPGLVDELYAEIWNGRTQNG